MDWESFAFGLGVGLATAGTLATLLVAAWRTRRARAEYGPVIERVQNVLIEKIRDIPADDLEKVREYICEISSLEPVRTDAAAEGAPAAPGRAPLPQSR